MHSKIEAVMQPHNRPESSHVITTPMWLLAVRVLQMVIAGAILGLAAAILTADFLLLALLGMSDAANLGIAIAVLTWLVVCYVVLSEKISPLHSFYHIIAVITLDALMLVLWLSAWALTAARRGTIAPLMKVANRDGSQKCDDPDSYFDYYGSYNDDCAGQKTIKEYKWRGDAGAAIAGLGALEWLLFIATFSWTLVAYVRTHSTSQNQSSIQMGTRNVKIPAEQTGDFVQNQHTSEPNLYRR